MQQEAVTREVVEGYRPSPQQRRVWSLLRRDEARANEATPYRAACAIDIEGVLDLRLLRAAVSDVVERHEVLRTTFKGVRGMSFPLQVVGDEAASDVEEEDIIGIQEPEQERIIRQRFAAELRRPFDFERGPLLRCTLFMKSADACTLIVSLPALCADTQSLHNLVNEVSSAYAALSRGETISGETMQYIVISEIANDLLESEETRAGRDYWRRQDISSIAQPRLPLLRESPAPFSPARVSAALSAELCSSLRTLCPGSGERLSSFLLACWQAVLWRNTSRPEFVVGLHCDGRADEELRPALGPLGRCLPVRAHVNAGLRFSGLWAAAADSSAEAIQWQDYFSWEESGEAEADYFSTSFEYEEREPVHVAGGLTFRVREQYVCSERYDLKLNCVSQDGGLLLELHYDRERYDETYAARLLEQLRTLARSAADDVETPLGELEVIGEAERRQLLVGWNDTRADYGPAVCLHTLFEAQAARTPDAVAVTFENQQLTYSELDARSNQLARHLHTLGVGPETRVGVCVERSLEMVVGLLGILKAGGAYVPLDPEYPHERIAYMLGDGEVTVLLTQSSLLGGLPQHAARVVSLDSDWPLVARQSDESPRVEATPDNAAYVLYTSGSTGRPKGVLVTHSAISNHMLWMAGEMPLGVADRVLQKTPLSFDASVWEFYAPLMAGARLVMAPPGVHRDSAALVRLMREELVTVVQVVPSMLRLLVEEDGIEACGSLRRVCVGGEALSAELVKRFKERVSAELYNLYGPTEATIEVSSWRANESERVTIGRPISNARMYVVDERLSPVPVGVAGELLIGGDGLARGYLKRAELTAEKFSPDPFGGEAGARLYRTGDLVRYLENGELEYLGRIDHQVKVRGFRIELGEIESALESNESVRQAVVVAREEEGGDKRLVAYVVSDGKESGTGELRAHLKGMLPEYMVPSAFVMLDEFPLTPNGKVDRNALPEPEHKAGEGEAGYVAPRTPTEEMLAGIWGEVLKVKGVGVEDNFFELGGHSLLATQVVSWVHEAFGVDVSLRSFFETPTVAGLAEAVEAKLKAGQALQSPPLARASRGGPLPLSFAQQRLWFINQLQPESAAYNMSGARRMKGRLDVEAVGRALTEIARRHEILRTTFETIEGRPAQVIHEPSRVELPLTDLTRLDEEGREAEVRRFAASEAVRPFDLARGPLLRTHLLRLEEEHHVLLFTMHHIVSDGWSLGVLVGELTALYEAFSQGRPSPLAELPVQYADYGAWQRDWLQGEVLAEQVAYWKGQLGGQPAALQLPTDRPRPAVQTFKGAKEVVWLPASLADSFKALSRQEGSTLFMTLLAAFKALLYRYTGQEDILVGTAVAGRDRVEVEKLIGFFVNTLVLRTDLSGGVSLRELVGRVREVALGAYTHHDLPFEILVEELQPERDLSRNPFFQVLFLLQNASQHVSFELPGLELTPLGGEFQSSQFDLTCNLADSPAGLYCSFEYNSDLFDPGTVRRMLSHFRTLLEQAAADPDRPLRSIPLVTQEEQSLLASWNDTRADYGPPRPLHELFEAQAARTPDAVALTFNGTELTYGELDARADRLARRLRALGVGPESRVGVCVERSLEMVVGLFGILKAGAAYVPLDPEYPQERVAFMLEDSGVSVLLTQSSLLGALPRGAAHVVALDADWPDDAPRADESPRAGATPDNAAYLIYTSGSTGRPKGVVITHRAVYNRLLWMQDAYRLDGTDRVLQKTPFSFDVSVWEFFWPLMTGARLVMARPGGHRDGAYLTETIARERITTLHFVPSMLQVFLEEKGLAERCAGLRRVICSGEALPFSLQERFFAQLDAGLHNLYGPTEAAVDVTAWACVPADERRTVPIGRPIANTQIYVLDDRLRPVPVGVAGELYIGGVQLARGYHGRPELTAEKFIPDPFGGEAGARLYRTGDLVRYLADGEIEYLGRIDHQVKVRGFRIELGEIESALEAHESVRQAVAVAREEEGGEKRLVAYVVGEGAGAGELRAHLRGRLPEYMVPSAFVFMEGLPLTPNGKVDRRALPEPEYLRPELEAAYVAPSNAPEKRLAAIWQQVLEVDEVGVEDNFFDLGGHSLLMAQVLGRVKREEVFDRELSMIEMFQYPTISALVGYMEREREEQLSRSKVNERAEKQKMAASRQRQAMKQRSKRDV